MSSLDSPSVTLEHELPGRLRLRLSHPLRKAERMRRMLAEHAGVVQVRYTPASRSVLVYYGPADVSAQEIVIRVAICLALEHDNAAVRVLARPQTRAWTDTAFYAGLALLAALAFRVGGWTMTGSRTLDWVASLGTAGAALEHGWLEVRRQGNFDPEVLTVTYLLTAMLRGNPLPAAIVTWLTTFGRHLVQLPAPGIELRPVEIGADGDIPRFEVVVAPDSVAPDKMTFFGMLPTLLVTALTGPPPHGNLIEEIRRVSRMHDRVLEASGGFRGIPLQIR